VTSFLFRTHPVSTVLGGLIVYPRDRARDVIRHYRDFMASAPAELTAYVIVDHANKMQSPLSAVVIEYYAGAAGRTGAGETAFAHRKAEYDVGFMAQWTDPAESDKHMAWARNVAGAMRPHSSGAYLLNFLSEEDADTIRAAFGANYPRLAQVKKKYDPTNFFSINQNIQPAA
jgi:FAD/FMN-containing dehydrogenase